MSSSRSLASLECSSSKRDTTEAVTYSHMLIQEKECEVESLNKEIQEYKQLLWTTKDENSLLKVKVRRLEENLKKKNRIVDAHYLGPHNKLLFRESMAQSTHRIEHLLEENKELKEDLFEKDRTIRQLRKKLSTFAAYKPQQKGGGGGKPSSTRSSYATIKSDTTRSSVSQPLQDPNDPNDPGTSHHVDEQETARSAQHTDTQTSLSPSTYGIEAPHEEIEKLHSDFKDVIKEVSKLKQSVSQIHEEHAKTVNDLRAREKDLVQQLYNKQEELMSHPVQKKKPLSRKTSARAGIEEQRMPIRNSTLAAQRVSSAFARVQQTTTPSKKYNKSPKKQNPFAIRTLSRNTLDETDVNLYIDEIIMDMNRSTLH